MNELSFRRALCGTLGITALVCLPAASAATPPTPEALSAQVADLSARIKELESALARLKAATPSPVPASATNTNVDARVRIIERRLEVNAEEAAATRAKVPAVSVSEKGLAVTSPDGNYELKVRGYIQTDARFFLDDESQSNADSFLMRRVRPIFEGTVAKQFYYRVMPDFAGASVTLQDAYAEWRQFPFAKVAVGKMKEPVGLERLASGSELAFVERGITNNLVPNRDVGLQVSGELLNGKLSYQTGVFDGDPDGENVAALDSSDDKDFAGRIMVQPFLDAYGPLQGLGFGISGTYGSELGAADSPNLGAYRTPAQVKFFKYRTTSNATTVVDVKGKETSVTLSPSLETTAIADGDRYRFSPQGFFYWRQFGFFGDYVESTQSVSFADHNAPVTNAAWQVSAFLVLTGEDANFKGIKPKANFDPVAGHWGAFELSTRYGELEIDDAAFAGISNDKLGKALADPTKSARFAGTWGLGLNWYLNRNFKVNVNYDETRFHGGGGGTLSAPLDRDTERALLTRFQLAY